MGGAQCNHAGQQGTPAGPASTGAGPKYYLAPNLLVLLHLAPQGGLHLLQSVDFVLALGLERQRCRVAWASMGMSMGAWASMGMSMGAWASMGMSMGAWA